MKKITNNAMENLSIIWEPTTTCNYSCWYCDPVYHDGKYRWPDLDPILDFFNDISKKFEKIYLDIAGGEPTLWPQLIYFLQNKPDNFRVNVTTNASRTINWWKKNWSFFDGVCLSFHPDSADPDHFYNVVETICNNGYRKQHIQTFLLTYEDKKDICSNLFERLNNSNLPINCKTTILDTRYIKDSKIISSRKNIELIEMATNNQFYRSASVSILAKPTEVYVDGKLTPLSKLNLWKLKDINRFYGWKCSAGKNRIQIEANGDIYRGSCRNGGKIGNIFFDTHINFSYSICEINNCACTDEIILEKYKIT